MARIIRDFNDGLISCYSRGWRSNWEDNFFFESHLNQKNIYSKAVEFYLSKGAILVCSNEKIEFFRQRTGFWDRLGFSEFRFAHKIDIEAFEAFESAHRVVSIRYSFNSKNKVFGIGSPATKLEVKTLKQQICCSSTICNSPVD